MTRFGHTTRIGAWALVALVTFLAAAASASAATRRHAIVAFVPDVRLAQLASIDGASVSLLGATQGRYRQLQALLDLSQGARTSLAAYDPPEPPALGVRTDGTILGWPAAVRRADAAPAPIEPGLFASSVPGGAAYVAAAGAPRDAAISAASRDGRVASMDLVDADADVAPAALRLARTRPLVVARVGSIDDLRVLARGRTPDTLVVALVEPPPSLITRLLPIGVIGLGGGHHTLTSATTRTNGLVTAIDVAPTVLDWLGLPIPKEMTGQRIERDGPLDLTALREQSDRLRVVTQRRNPTLGFLAGGWLILVVAGFAVGALTGRWRRGVRWAVRVGALGVLWLLPVLLASAALAPRKLTEEVGVAVAVLALGALTDRLVRWPLAPAVPGIVGTVAYMVDLFFGSTLVVRSLLGPNPLYGSRFYGIGNELESTLPVLALCGVAAAAVAIGWGRRSRALALAFAGTGLALGVVVGAGRLGADVGGVVTIGAGTAVAVLLALPGEITWRRVAVGVAVPILAIGALALLDLATGGDGHFTRTVLRAGSDQALEDVIRRRYELAWNNLTQGIWPLLTLAALGAVAWGVARRDRLLRDVPGADAWRAALAGSAAAGIAGSLSNDSGPLLAVFATFVAAWVAAYLRAGAPSRAPENAAAPGAASPVRATET
jgi:hypothetical protein